MCQTSKKNQSVFQMFNQGMARTMSPVMADQSGFLLSQNTISAAAATTSRYVQLQERVSSQSVTHRNGLRDGTSTFKPVADQMNGIRMAAKIAQRNTFGPIGCLGRWIMSGRMPRSGTVIPAAF